MITTGKDVLLRSASERAEDLSRITELVRVLRAEAPPLDVDRLTAVSESGCAAFYRIDGQIVGCAHLAVYPHLAFTMASIESVVVDNRFRRRGIARALVTYLVEYARRQNLMRVVLLTETENSGARSLYTSVGFTEYDLKRFRLYF